MAGRTSPYEFQMLFGIRTQLQQKLVRQGHPLRIYVPYGSEWYPYLTRRLAEQVLRVTAATVGVFVLGAWASELLWALVAGSLVLALGDPA